jgi:hypothetical protein
MEMSIKNKRGQEWDVKNGKAVLVTPAVEEASEEVPVARLNREIARATRRKEALQQALARAQAEYDEAAQYETELVAIRDSVDG